MLEHIQRVERQWIEGLQQALQSPLLDLFFRGWNFVDSFGFMALVITFVWYVLGKQRGIKLFYIIILSAAINTSLKSIFTLPRPCHIVPSIGMLCPVSYGMPSGAAQSAVLLGAILFFESKRALWKIIATMFTLLLCFSRIYLGVHYISDVVAGMLIGAFLAYVYFHLLPLALQHQKKMMIAFPLLIFLIGGPFAPLFLSFTIGMQLGLLAEKEKITKPQSLSFRLGLAIFIAIGLFSLAYFAMQNAPLKLVFGLVMGTWLSFLGLGAFYFITKNKNPFTNR